jgi:hypothetical protein
MGPAGRPRCAGTAPVVVINKEKVAASQQIITATNFDRRFPIPISLLLHSQNARCL